MKSVAKATVVVSAAKHASGREMKIKRGGSMSVSGSVRTECIVEF
jgi:hypothetical protein